MELDRKKNVITGTFYGILLKALQIIFPFIIRTIFIRTIGIEYLGLNSLFTSVLQVLNLAELGVSLALVFSMYRPIAEQDDEKICHLMKLYKIYYWIIGTVILFIGMSLMPFLQYLIKDTVPNNINIYILYTMQLTATVLSYWLFAYRSSILMAYQRNDVLNIISIIVNFALYIVQILILIAFENYYLYLLSAISAQLLNNIVAAIYSKKLYPQYEPKGELPKEEHKEINMKVRDLFTSKIGGVVNNSADSIVISAMLGLELLAVYQNYYYIISAIMALFNIFFSACTAGIGNSLIVNSKEQNIILFYKINHIVFLTINWCCACFISMCQLFMLLWVGKEYELNFSFVILFAIYLFAEEAPRPLIVFKDAGGIWKHDRFRPLIAAFINLILNLLLTPKIGLYGIIISTIFALIFVAYPWLIININKRLINIGVKRYVAKIVIYIIVISANSTFAYFVCNAIMIDSTILTITIRFLLSIVLSTTVFMVCFWKTSENRYVIEQIVTLKNRFTSR